jgi:spore coat protein U-like protein
MQKRIRNLSRLLVLASTLTAASWAQAATATATIGLSATVTSNCTISTAPVGFGAYDPVSGSNITAEGSVTVACTRNATGLWVGLDTGANGARNLKGAVKNDMLAYSIKRPVSTAANAACPAYGAGDAWDNTSVTALSLTVPLTKASRTYNVCGQIAQGQDMSVDSYSDTVTASINF